jgi:outer membrane cobalamin receptor
MDAETLHPLARVNVFARGMELVTTSDSNGYYLVRADSVPPVLLFTLDGYQPSRQQPRAGGSVTVTLAPVQYEMKEVVVTATRQAITRDDSPTPVAVVTRAAIDLKGGSSLAEMLDGTPGLCFRAYGGDGALHTASIRGMSPEHSLLLIDGRRYASSQNGQIDLALVSMANVERVEVVRGGSSSLYGADAVGGVVNLITRKPTASLGARLSSSFGSYGFLAYEVGLSGSSGALGWRSVVRREKGDGDYTFDFSDGRTSTPLQRTGADFDLLLADLEMDYAPGSASSSAFTLSYSTADRGTPGSVTDITTLSQARLTDNVVRSSLTLDWKVSSSIRTVVNTTFQYGDQRYTDPLLVLDNVPLHSFSVNRSVLLSPEIRGDFSPAVKSIAGLEIGRSWIRSNEVQDAIRWQRSAFLATEHRFALPSSVPFEIALYPSLRYDSFSDVDGDISPKLGINLGLLRQPSLRLRSSYGKSYRIPTFNDLYWRQGGNPLLKPERSVSFDVGLAARLHLLGFVNMEAGYFSIATRDRIVWTPGAGSVWSPRNIAQAESHGVEAQVNWIDTRGLVSLTVNSTWTTARKTSADYPGDATRGKILIYTPRQTVHLTAQLFAEPFSASVEHGWVSHRYTTETNDRTLPAYGVTSATARIRIPVGKWTGVAKLEASNLFNTSYQVIALFPMPGREFRITLGAEL